jgi:hypothetical protein
MSNPPRKDPFGLDAELDSMLADLNAGLDAALGRAAPATALGRPSSPAPSASPPAAPSAADLFARRPAPVLPPPPDARPDVLGRQGGPGTDASLAGQVSVSEASGLTVECVDTVNALLDHVREPTVTRVAFRNRTGRPLANARIVIGGVDSPYISKWSATINAALRNVVEQTDDTICVEVFDGVTPVASATVPVRVQSYNHWPMVGSRLWTLAAFVWPNQSAVQGLIARAANVQQQRFGTTAFEGYQGSPARVLAQVASLYDVLGPAGIGLHYINPPASFRAVDGSFGQKIRFPNNVVSDGRGTCLDLAVLLASMLEQVRIDPILVVIYGHAFVAYWTEAETEAVPHLLGDRQVDLLQSAAAQRLVMDGKIEFLNSTDMTKGGGFESAVQTGRAFVEQALDARRAGRGLPANFVMLINLADCRHAGLLPLPPV